jgi:hypothetical protein
LPFICVIERLRNPFNPNYAIEKKRNNAVLVCHRFHSFPQKNSNKIRVIRAPVPLFGNPCLRISIAQFEFNHANFETEL